MSREASEAVNFRKIVEEHHGLPKSSRTVQEILEDYATERAFAESFKASVERQKIPSFSSELVVRVLDDHYRRKARRDEMVGQLVMPILTLMLADENALDRQQIPFV